MPIITSFVAALPHCVNEPFKTRVSLNYYNCPIALSDKISTANYPDGALIVKLMNSDYCLGLASYVH